MKTEYIAHEQCMSISLQKIRIIGRHRCYFLFLKIIFYVINAIEYTT